MIMPANGEGAAGIRAFIAVMLDEAIAQRLAEVQQQLRHAGADVNWVRPEAMHVTLRFLGDVPAARVEAIGAALAPVAGDAAPFTLVVGTAGVLPTPTRPRVVWAGVREGAEAMGRLARGIEAALRPLGFPREARPFRPHITLGRVRSSRGLPALLELLGARADVTVGAMRVGAMALMRSELSRDGARYTPVRVLPLGDK